MENKTSRRQFIKTAALLSGGLLFGCEPSYDRIQRRGVLPILATNPAIRFNPHDCRGR